ncbi:MAG TPA: hypothetical protein PKD09_08375 [Aggregatilinea sp.]|uniref:hypothetical protein n=1 Tax=Aggregatilinea sp. TaxID=2806333 RepID=UPI002B6AE63A|nr:hypothetical protein [Aggregatilinea sp.]HML21647.1 hypothetical protein [Aggregatilinea sp.]
MDSPKDFLVAEYETLKEFRTSQVEQAQNRFNFFLILVSSAVGIVALVSDGQNSFDTPIFFIVVSLTALALLYLGTVTLRRIIQTHIQTVRYTRGLNRIRRYFVQQFPEIEEYLTFSTDDRKPQFGAMGSLTIGITGLTGMVIFINATLAYIGISFLLQALMKSVDHEYTLVSVLIGAVPFIGAILLQRRYLNSEVEKAKTKYDK